MGVDSRHPEFTERLPDWEQMRDTYRGERQVKRRSFRYLPATPGMIEDGVESSTETKGYKAYVAYRTRAVLPAIVREAVEAMLGVMHHKPAKIEVPSKLDPLMERATLRGEPMDALLRRINEEQLIQGRLGLLLEVPSGRGAQLPYIALYQAEDIVNWDDGGRDDESQLDKLNLVVLDETADVRGAEFEWETVEKYRVLVLGDPDMNEQTGVYRVGVFRRGDSLDESMLQEPMVAGRRFDRVPFTFVNTKDIVPAPDDPPLLGLSNLALAIYRGEADYRQALYMQGQDTLVTIGTTDDDPLRTGAGARINIPVTDGDAKFIGVDSSGLPEMRAALENDYSRAEQRAGALVEAVSRAAESGEALRVRVAARTASLNQIALTGAFALEDQLRMAAVAVGANPDEVRVAPNLDFVADTVPAREIVELMQAKALGAPIALQTVHEFAQSRGLTAMSWEDERARLEEEGSEGLPGALPIGFQPEDRDDGDGLGDAA